jgi:hypothetical protein
MSNLKKSTFKLGFENKLNCLTENSDKFSYPQQNLTSNNQAAQNNELKNYLKGHHFEFGPKTVKNSFQARTPLNKSSDLSKSHA